MRKLSIIVLSVFILCSISCAENKQNIKTEKIANIISEDEIKDDMVILYSKEHSNFIVRFSNIILMSIKNRDFKFKAPIFEGYCGDVYEVDLCKYLEKKGMIEKNHGMGGNVIKCKKGEVRKKFIEFLDFYKEKFKDYIDITKPEPWNYFIDNNHAQYFYQFEVDGEKISFEFLIKVKPGSKEKNNPYDLEIDETLKDPVIYFGIY